MGLLDEFYNEDLNQYYYVEEGGMYYYEEEDGLYYEEEDGLYYDDEGYYYADEEDTLYYQDEIVYYDDDNGSLYYQDEIIYYDDEEEEAPMYFKKEINVAPKVINTPRDASGSSWDAASYEIDGEIEAIANEEDVDYATAYRIFGQRYESYDPDLSDYM